jgi:hypothetical protein
MAVLGLNSPVLAMDQKFRSLVLRDFSRSVNRVRLAIKDLSGSGGVRPLDRPLIVTWDYMLIAFCHF